MIEQLEKNGSRTEASFKSSFCAAVCFQKGLTPPRLDEILMKIAIK
jgi:hypothetical protein